MRQAAVRPYIFLLWALPALVLLLLPFGAASAQEFAERVLKQGHYLQDQYLAGETVEVRALVEGDVVVAGGRVMIEEQVTGDVIAAGGTVDIRAVVGDDVRAAGGRVLVSGDVAGDLIAAGGQVTLPVDATVGERAWLAGGEVLVAGFVGQELRAAGGEITLSGEIDGDVLAYGEKLRVLPTARIAGRLVHYGPAPAEIAPAAEILGGVTHHRVEIDTHAGERMVRGMATLLLLALLTAGIALYLAFHHFASASVTVLQERPWASLGIGLAVFFTVPPVSLLLLMTGIGAVLAAIAMTLYALLLLAGFLLAMLCAGDLLLGLVHRNGTATRPWRVLSLVAVFLVLWVTGFMPVLGVVIGYFVMMFGAGALMLKFHRMYHAYRKVEGEA